MRAYGFSARRAFGVGAVGQQFVDNAVQALNLGLQLVACWRVGLPSFPSWLPMLIDQFSVRRKFYPAVRLPLCVTNEYLVEERFSVVAAQYNHISVVINHCAFHLCSVVGCRQLEQFPLLQTFQCLPLAAEGLFANVPVAPLVVGAR